MKPVVLFAILLTCVSLAHGITIGDTAADVRRADGRIDVEATLDAIQRLHCNTYFFFVWPNEHDWEDLPKLADRAAGRNISIWVYVAPWSETPGGGKRKNYSEPFKNDYARWGQEIAKLSLKYPNIVGWCIDDFWDNTPQPERFSPKYVARMTEGARAINPKLKFYPLLYFFTPWDAFMAKYAKAVDGVVVCYPKGRAGIDNAWAHLSGKKCGPSIQVEMPRGREYDDGDGAKASATFDIADARECRLSFYFDATDDHDNATHNRASLRLDGKTVWQTRTSGATPEGIVDLDLREFVRKKKQIKVEFVVEAKNDSRGPLVGPVIVRFDDVRMLGVNRDSNAFVTGVKWEVKKRGQFVEASASSGTKADTGTRLPMLLMPAAEPNQHQKRYDEPGTPAAIAEKIRLSLEAAMAGRAEGVILWCTPKGAGNPYFAAAKREIESAVKGAR